MPRPPALLTAAANSGVVAPPIGACWIGTWQPTSSVNAVANMAEVWRDLGSLAAASDRIGFTVAQVH